MSARTQQIKIRSNRTEDAILKSSFKFPLRPDGRGRLQTVSGKPNLEQDMLHWLKTFLGEQMFNRDKGLGVYKWVHMPASQVIALAPGEIELGLMQWEKKLKSVKVGAAAGTADRTVNIEIRYLPIGYEVEGNLTYTLQLEGSV